MWIWKSLRAYFLLQSVRGLVLSVNFSSFLFQPLVCHFSEQSPAARPLASHLLCLPLAWRGCSISSASIHPFYWISNCYQECRETPTRRWEDNIKTDINKQSVKMWTGFLWFRTAPSGELSWPRQWTFGFYESYGTWAEQWLTCLNCEIE
jgi:hypothetical protein